MSPPVCDCDVTLTEWAVARSDAAYVVRTVDGPSVGAHQIFDCCGVVDQCYSVIVSHVGSCVGEAVVLH